MKKNILSLLLFGCTFFLNAQCTVQLDAVANANGACFNDNNDVRF